MTHPTGPPDVDVEEVKRSLARRAEYNNGRLARDALAVIKALEKDSKESLDLYRNNRTRLEARIAALEEAARCSNKGLRSRIAQLEEELARLRT